MEPDEDDDVSSESEEENQEIVFFKALNRYCLELGGSKTIDKAKYKDFLKVTFNNNSCLICLSGVKRLQAVWSCRLCYTLFHLVCIQHWAKDGVMVKNAILSEEFFPGISLKWTCPKCRGEYNPTDTPSIYKCFCGKQVVNYHYH